jgi:hypothetical protein
VCLDNVNVLFDFLLDLWTTLYEILLDCCFDVLCVVSLVFNSFVILELELILDHLAIILVVKILF